MTLDRCRYEFGPFSLDSAARVLMREGEMVPLTPKAFETLLVLVSRRGEIVEREQLIKAIWPDSYVEEGNLSSNISTLRKALGDDRGERCYIETVPRRGYRFVASVRESQEITPKVDAELARSIAVLPFKQLSTARSDDYLGLGMADTLITLLSNLRQIVVRPTSAVLRYVGREQDAVAAGRELRVESVLEGSIRREADRVRVTVQMVSVKDAAPLWAEKFDEKFTDIFAVEDSICTRVAKALMLQLADGQSLTRRHAENTEAYHLYLQGHYFCNKRTEEGLRRSIDYFAMAAAKDPNYARAFAGLAKAYALLGGAVRPREIIKQAKAAALKALDLDEMLADAHTSMLLVKMLYDWDWNAAEREYQRATELNPYQVTAHHWYGLCLALTGRVDGALASLQHAQQLDPCSPIIDAHIAWAYYSARRYDEAIAQCLKTIEMDPHCYRAHVYLGWAYEQTGEYELATAELQRGMELARAGPEIAGLGYSYAIAGRRDEARQLIVDLGQRAQERYISPFAVALIHAGLGQNDQAFDWLEKAIEDRSHWLVFLKVDPRLDCLRKDARFEDLLKRVGFQTKGEGEVSMPR